MDGSVHRSANCSSGIGHEVTVIDHDANALARLGTDFKGKVVHGIGFDRNVLLEAGIETAEGICRRQFLG